MSAALCKRYANETFGFSCKWCLHTFAEIWGWICSQKKWLLICAPSHRNAGHKTPSDILCSIPLQELTFSVLHAKLSIKHIGHATTLQCPSSTHVLCTMGAVHANEKKSSAGRCREVALGWQISALFFFQIKRFKRHHFCIYSWTEGNTTILWYPALLSAAFSKMLRKQLFEMLCK